MINKPLHRTLFAFSAIALFISCMTLRAEQLPLLTDLASLQWKYRIVIVNDNQHEAKPLALFEQYAADIDDRDIAWFVIRKDRVLTNYPGELSKDFLKHMQKQYGTEQGGVILIGKDGGIKNRLNQLDLDTIFSDIDAMPMRQFEMQN